MIRDNFVFLDMISNSPALTGVLVIEMICGNK